MLKNKDNFSYRKDGRSIDSFCRDLQSGNRYNILFAKFVDFIFCHTDIHKYNILEYKVGIEKKHNSLIKNDLKDCGDVALSFRKYGEKIKSVVFEISASPYILSNGIVNKSSYCKCRLKVDSYKKILKENRILIFMRSKDKNSVEFSMPSLLFMNNIPNNFSVVNIRNDSNKKCFEIMYNKISKWFNIDFSCSKSNIEEVFQNILNHQKDFKNQDILRTGLFEEIRYNDEE